MKTNIKSLFTDYCTIIFTYEDGSQVKAITTLNKELLKREGYGEVDGMVDLTTGKLIPEELFEESFDIIVGVEKLTNSLDLYFEKYAKTSWIG